MTKKKREKLKKILSSLSPEPKPKIEIREVVKVVEKIVEKPAKTDLPFFFKVIRKIIKVSSTQKKESAKLKDDIESVQKELESKIGEVEKKIPEIPEVTEVDLAPIEKDIEELKEKIKREKIEILERVANTGSGNMNRQIKVDGVNVLTKYTDIDLVAGTNIVLTPTVSETNKNVEIEIVAQNDATAVWGSITGTLSNQTDLQSALDLKANLASPTFTGTVVLPSTTSIGTVSNTEIGYLDGVTSAIQTQLDAKLSITTAATTYVPYTGATNDVDLGAFGIATDHVDITSYFQLFNSSSIDFFSDSGITQTGAIFSNGAGLYSFNNPSVSSPVLDFSNATTDKVYTFPDVSGTVALTSDIPSAITALTGDGTATGPGSVALTLATVNANVGSFGSSTSIPSFTVNAKGLITAASGNAVIAPAGTLTGTTLASNVVTSSLTTIGTLVGGAVPASLVTAGTFGTGAYVMDTSLTNPLLIGGTGTTSDLILRTTSGVGATGADMIFQVGNNGGTEAMRILNSGFVGVGTTAPEAPFDVLGMTVGNATYDHTMALRDPTNMAAGVGGVMLFSGEAASGSPAQFYGGFLRAAKTNAVSGNYSFDFVIGTRLNGAAPSETLRITDVKNVKINGSALRGTTEGTNQLVIFNGTAPAGTLTNGISLYSASGEFRVMNAAGAVTLISGVYTPTRSAEANMDANVTMTEAQYMRVGHTVTVSGRFTADPTLTATTTSFEITLPIASNIGAAEDVAGVAFCGNIVSMGAEIIGVVANDTAKIQWKSSDVTSQTWSYTFTYQVI